MSLSESLLSLGCLFIFESDCIFKLSQLRCQLCLFSAPFVLVSFIVSLHDLRCLISTHSRQCTTALLHQLPLQCLVLSGKLGESLLKGLEACLFLFQSVFQVELFVLEL